MPNRSRPDSKLRVRLNVIVLAIYIAAAASFALGFGVGGLIFLALAIYPAFTAISPR